jgi:ribosomal-protein-alanine N-acetyltransferase
MTLLRTKRLDLVPMTLDMVEAVMLGRKDDSELFAGARMPARWPNPELIERAFPISLDELRADPAARLWGARVMIAGGEQAGGGIAVPAQAGQPVPPRRVVGSVVFRHGFPDDGVAEIAYGVEEGSQRQGYATEAVTACVAWALAQPGVHAVRAATFEWHQPSVRVLRASGMTHVGAREHETMGEMAVFERESSSMKARRPL